MQMAPASFPVPAHNILQSWNRPDLTELKGRRIIKAANDSWLQRCYHPFPLLIIAVIKQPPRSLNRGGRWRCLGAAILTQRPAGGRGRAGSAMRVCFAVCLTARDFFLFIWGVGVGLRCSWISFLVVLMIWGGFYAFLGIGVFADFF